MKNIMKSNYRYIVKAFMAMAVIAGTTSCDDFLDREPMSSISPETYYLNSPSFTRSVVGRVSIPSSSFSRRPRAEPVITRMALPPSALPPIGQHSP